ncbi:hypothetical protein [Streptomyces sp. V4I2]|uniref:hypothetical protein n=1 Tax=Streptomyces sp. V4I2 TaxID=3042280 RepID=UPI0027D83ED7|nr:hypothetical protein [Streptomyces sp. V4I2]
MHRTGDDRTSERPQPDHESHVLWAIHQADAKDRVPRGRIDDRFSDGLGFGDGDPGRERRPADTRAGRVR